MIYFYFNTEIRHEVLRQVQRTLSRNENVRGSSTGDTLSTRLSVFRKSLSRHRKSSTPNRSEKRRPTMPLSPPVVLKTRQICWRKCLAFICPCLFNNNNNLLEAEQQQPERRLSIHPMNHRQNETAPGLQSNLIPDDYDDDVGGIASPLLIQNHSTKGLIDNDALTCDTVVVKNESDDDLLSSENEVTIHQTSSTGDQISMISNHTPLLARENSEDYRSRSKSDGHTLKELAMKYSSDNKSLR